MTDKHTDTYTLHVHTFKTHVDKTIHTHARTHTHTHTHTNTNTNIGRQTPCHGSFHSPIPSHIHWQTCWFSSLNGDATKSTPDMATTITVLGWLKKEERKKEVNNSDFWTFQVCHFKSYKLLLLLQTGVSSISCLLYVLVPQWWYHRVNRNTLIGAAILFSDYATMSP